MIESIGKKNRANQQRIIALWMMFCFMVSYLPVTHSWYLSLKGRDDLAQIVVAVVQAQIDIKKNAPVKDRKQALDNIFKELKIATGKITVMPAPDKGGILLTQINPEIPLLQTSFRLRVDKTHFYTIMNEIKQYQSIFLTIDPRPPENYIV
ncbi:MAG: hypothetical protein ABIJ31_14045 [Pseudomonadota bacterium]